MNVVDANLLSKPNDLVARNLGIPVIAVIGLPLLALLALLFLGFGFALQSQRTDLTRNYSERTAEFLARDLADQLGRLMTPAAHYVDGLAAEIREAGCNTGACVFALIEKQRAQAASIPPQVAYVRFGSRDGHVFSIFKVDENDSGFRGTVRTMENDPGRLLLMEPGAEAKSHPFNLFDKGWYQGGIIDSEPIWSAPYRNIVTNRCKRGDSNTWNVNRLVRIDDMQGKPLGVLTADLCISRIASFLQNVTGKVVEKISIRPRSGEDILV
ncbi:MAG: PDC sensor domain-containing protein [Phyllobacterium sp.]